MTTWLPSVVGRSAGLLHSHSTALTDGLAVPLDRRPAPPPGCCRESLRSGSAACPSTPGSDAATPIHVVGPHRQRDLRELRTVERPVHLDGLDVVREQPRQRDLLHVVVAGGRRRDRHRARQRREARKPPSGALEVAGARDHGDPLRAPTGLHGQPRDDQPAAGARDSTAAPTSSSTIDRQLGDGLEPRSARARAQNAPRDVPGRKRLQVGERKPA